MPPLFFRAVAVFLVSLLVAGDASWAHGLLSPRMRSSPDGTLIQTQAIIPHLVIGVHAPLDPIASLLVEERPPTGPSRRSFLHLFTAGVAFASTVFGQKPVSRSPAPFDQISVPEAMKADAEAANPNGKGWHLGVPRPANIDNATDPTVLAYLIDNSESAALASQANAADRERYFAAASEMTSLNFSPDRSRAAVAPLAEGFLSQGAKADLGSIVVYPEFNDQSPLGKTIQAHPAQRPGFFPKFFSYVKDIILYGGVEWTNGVAASKNLVQIAIAAIRVHMGWEEVESSGETLVQTYQHGLNDLRMIDQKILLLELEKQITSKKLVDQSKSIYAELSPAQFLQETASLTNALKDLSDKINAAKDERTVTSNDLRRLEKWNRPIAQVPSLSPRHPVIPVNREWLEKIANLKLPDDETPLPVLTLSDDLAKRLRQGFLSRLRRLDHKMSASEFQKAESLDPFSDEFLNLVLNRIWNVSGASAIGDNILLVNSEERPTIEDLTTIPAEDESLLGYPPSVRRVLFLKELARQREALDKLAAKADWAVALRLNLSLALPVRFAVNGNKPLKTDRLVHEETAEAITAAGVALQVQQLMNEGPLKSLQVTRTAWISALREARDWARQAITTYPILADQLSLTLQPKFDVTTPGSTLLRSRASTRAFLTNAYGEQKNLILLTPQGQETRATVIADHFASMMRLMALNFDAKKVDMTTQEPVATPVAPKTPASKPVERHHIEWPWSLRSHDNRSSLNKSPATEKMETAASPVPEPVTRRSLFSVLRRSTTVLNTLVLLGVVGSFSSLIGAPVQTAHTIHSMLPTINPLAQSLGWWILPAIVALGTLTHSGVRQANTRWTVRFPLVGLLIASMVLTYPHYMVASWLYPLMGAFFILGWFKARWFKRTLIAMALFVPIPVVTHPLIFGVTLLMTLWGKWNSNYVFHVVMGLVFYFTLPAWLPAWILIAAPAVLIGISWTTSAQSNLRFDKQNVIPYNFLHWRKRLSTTTLVLHWTMRLAIAGFALYNLSPVIEALMNRSLSSLNLGAIDQTQVSGRVYKRPLYIAAPKGESGTIVNSPLSKGLVHVTNSITVDGKRLPVYIVAWKSNKDPSFLSQIRDYNARTPGAHIQGEEVLETEAADSPYTHAVVQIVSDDGPGSIEATLEKALASLQTAMVRYQISVERGEQFRAITHATTVSADERLLRQEIDALAETVNTLLQERRWRDVKVLQSFDMAPDRDQLGARTTFTNTPVVLGTMVRRDVGQFDIKFLRSEIREFALFLHRSDLVAIFENTDDKAPGDPLVFTPSAIKLTTETLGRTGFFSHQESLSNEGLIPEFDVSLWASMPKGHFLSDETKNYRFAGIFPSSAQKPDGSWDDNRRVKVPETKPNEYVALVEIVHNQPVYRRFPGPQEALDRLENVLTGITQGFRNEAAKYRGILEHDVSNSALGQSAQPLVQKIISDAETSAIDAQTHTEDVATQIANWNTQGVSSSDLLTPATASHPEGKAYPTSLFASQVPIEQKYRISVPGKEDDPQTAYPIGDLVRIRAHLEVGDASKLRFDSSHPLLLHIEGTDIDLPLTEFVNGNPFERGLPDQALTFETSVPALAILSMFPQVAHGDSPLGDFVATIRQPGAVPPASTPTPPTVKKTKNKMFSLSGSVGLQIALMDPHWWSQLWHRVPTDLQSFIIATTVSLMVGTGILFLNNVWPQLKTLLRRMVQPAPDDQLKKVSEDARHDDTMQFQGYTLTPEADAPAEEFFNLIGYKRIKSSSLVNSRADETLLWDWRTFNDKKIVATAIAAGVAQLDDQLLNLIAHRIGGVSTRSKRSVKTELQTALWDAFDRDDFRIVTLNTLSQQSLMDVTTTPNSRTLRIDGRLIRTYLQALNDPHMKPLDIKATQLSLAVIFIYALGYPRDGDFPEYDREDFKQLHQIQVEQFLEIVNQLWISIDQPPTSTSDYNLRQTVEKLRGLRRVENRELNGKRPSLVDTFTTLDLELHLPLLSDLLRNAPLKEEVVENGNRLSPWIILKNGFQWDIIPLQMYVMTAKYFVDKMEPWAQKRTSFVKVEVWGVILLLIVYVILYPQSLQTAVGSIIRGTANYTFLFTHTSDPNAPAWTLKLLMYLLVTAVFLSALKSVSEIGTAGLQPLLNDLLRMFKAHQIEAEFTKSISEERPGMTVKKYLDTFYKTPPLADETNFQELFFNFSSMMTTLIYQVLNQKQISGGLPLSYKRYFVEALYLYAQQSPKRKFFGRWTKIQTSNLPTMAEVMEKLTKKNKAFAHLSAEEIRKLAQPKNTKALQAVRQVLNQPAWTPDDFASLSARDANVAMITLAGAGFYGWSSDHDDAIQNERVLQVSKAMLEFPIDVLLVLISRNCTGLAFFDGGKKDLSKERMRAAMEPVLRDIIHRTSTLAPEIHESWREQSRDTQMWWQNHLSRQVLRRNQSVHAPLLYSAYRDVLSPVQGDLTTLDERLLPGLLGRHPLFKNHPKRMQLFIRWIGFWRGQLAGVSQSYPTLTLKIKSILQLCRTGQDPVENLALNMVLKDMNPTYRENAIAILKGILIQKFHEVQQAKGFIDVNALIETDDFRLFDRLAELSDMSLKQYLEAFRGDTSAVMALVGPAALMMSEDDRQRLVAESFIDRLHLPEGVSTGFTGQQDNREGKIYPERHKTRLGKLLPGRDPSDPTLFPFYLEDPILPDDKLNPVVTVAEMKTVEQAGVDFLALLIRYTTKNGPRAFGDREIITEVTMPRTLKSASLIARRNITLTKGPNYFVGVSEIVRTFVARIDSRISERLEHGGLSVEVLLYKKLANYLRQVPHVEQRVFFVSPELKSTKVALDPTLQDTDVVLVPHPTLYPAAEGLYFAMLPQTAKQAFYDSVEAKFGTDAVKEIQLREDQLVQIILSSQLELHTFADASDRWKWNSQKKTYEDVLQLLLPPNGFRAFAIIAQAARLKPDFYHGSSIPESVVTPPTENPQPVKNRRLPVRARRLARAA